MLRVVLDTNIIVSAVLTPTGAPAQVFTLALAGLDLTICLSGPIFAEYEEVLRRPRFRRTEDEIQAALSAIRSSSLWFAPTHRISVCPDPDDNIFLECAQAANADYLITGNTRHFPSTWANTRVISPRDLLDHIV